MFQGLILAALFAAGAGLVAASPEAGVLQARSGPNDPPVAIFIRADRLTELSAELVGGPKLAFDDVGSKQETLSDLLAKAKATFASRGCNAPSMGNVPQDSSAPPTNLTRFVFSEHPVSFVGVVTRVEPGWMPSSVAGASGLVGTLVTARIKEVLRQSPDRSVVPGKDVTFLEKFGSFEYEGVRFCTHDSETTPLAVGDVVAVAGESDGLNPSHVMTASAATFIVRGGFAHPTRPLEAGREVAGLPLTEIRQIAKAGVASVGARSSQ